MATDDTRVAVVVLDDYQGVTRDFGPWEELEDRIELDVVREHYLDDDALVERVAHAEVLLLMRERTPLTRERIQRMPSLRLVVTKGMRNAAIDFGAAADHHVLVSGTGNRSEAPVEITFALMLALARHVCEEHQRMREGAWQETVGTELHGRTLGLVGLGRLGTKVAHIAAAFGMDVIAWSQNLTEADAAARGARSVTKAALLETSDFVSLHTRLSDRTRGLIGAAELERMAPTAYLVNTARGPIVDEPALLAALHSGQIAGAGLDVYDIEPLPPGHPLRSAPNVVLTPHLGYVAVDSYRTHFTEAVENIRTWLDGHPVRVISDTST